MPACVGMTYAIMRRTVLAPVTLLAMLAPHPAYAAPALDGAAMRWPWALPFVGILLTIATGPLLFPRLWHHHYGKLAFAWSVLTLAPLAAFYGTTGAVAAFVHAMLAEYLSFIVLLFALYVVAGGILVTGNLRGTPLVNTAILAFGTLIASVVGTTGAAMILDPPAHPRQRGDGSTMSMWSCSSSSWSPISAARSPRSATRRCSSASCTASTSSGPARNLWSQTALVAGLVLAAFLVLDLWHYRKDRLVTTVGEGKPAAKLGVSGGINLLLIAGIIAAILASATWQPGIGFEVYGTAVELQNIARDTALVLIVILSLVLTPNEHREANGFTWEPIAEVAILFAGIFICIIPVLAALHAGKDGSLYWLLAAVTANGGKPHDLAYFWLTGALSAFLDNAPTYLVFFRARRRRCPRADGAAGLDARGDLHGSGLYGRADLYRQRAELHGLRHRGRARREDAELLRLHAVVGARAAAGLRAPHFGRDRKALVAARGLRPATARLELALDAALDPAAGSTATASISSNAPGRASPEIAMVVLAGRSFSGR